MKRFLVSTVVVLVILASAWTVFGQSEARRQRPRERGDWRMFQMLSPEEAAKMREKWPNMSDEEREKFRAQMRERWENMSEEEREKLRTQMRERFGSRRRGLGPEEQLNAIKVIEGQLAKLKASVEAMGSGEQRPPSGLSEEERAKLRERFSKAREEQQEALKMIIKQIAILQGQRQQVAEGEEFIIVDTGELKAIHQLAVKEKAEETARRLDMIGRGQRGFRGRPLAPIPASPRAIEGSRGPRRRGPQSGPGAPGGQEEKKAEVEE